MKRPGTNLLQAALLATSSLVAAGAFCPAIAAGPAGAQVVFGQATITRPKADETLITQTSNRALIDWTSFSIPSGSLVDFDQPGKSSLTVNRVTGPDTSQIDGELLANGAIWLINANGIIFDRGSQIDVGALLATTSDISDNDLQDGRYGFSKRSPNPNAAVVNRGTIRTTSGGSVVLSASRVSNQGMIEANLGTVVMGGANAFIVDMAGDNLIRYQITSPVTSAPKAADGKPAAALVSNSGTVSAAGGKVLMTANAVKSVQDDVINNTGIVEATSVSSHDGEIDLDAGPNGTVDVGGTLNASGNAAGEKGGNVEITGDAVHVENGAALNASGADGGGTVLIGGGFHGNGPIANAATTLVGNATIDVNALAKGNGGKVAVWSDKHTVFAGKISARGGSQGGNGGYVETSSGVSLQVALDAVVNASAPQGSEGSWLLDPLNIIIETGGTTQLNHGVLGLNVDKGKTDTVDPSTITDALETTNVLLEAANDITVLNDVIYGSTNSLLLLAEHDINAYANVQNTMASGGGGVYLIAGWNGTTTNIAQLTNSGVYGNNGGGIFVGTTNAPDNVAVGSASGQTVAAGDNVTVEADNGYAQIGYAGTGGGNIDVLATGDVTVDALNNPFAQIGNGGGSVVGNVGGNIEVDAGGSVTVEAPFNDDSDYTLADIGNVAGGGSSSESGNIFIDAPGGVDVSATGLASNAFIGNGDYVSSTGGATGNITISTGALTVYADNTQQGISEAFIGDGGQFRNGGTSGGNIDITASSIDIEADASNTSESQARIANRSTGDVIGDINIATTGNITLFGNDQDETSSALVRIGDVSDGCESPPCSGTVTGNVTIQSDDMISLLTQNTGGVFIGNGGAVNGGNISVTAAGDITFDESGSGSNSSGIEIGTFDDGIGGGGANVTVTSTNGTITLDADASTAGIFIGNSSNGYNFATSGNVSLYAPNGNIMLSAAGAGATILVGDTNFSGPAPVTGDITVTAGDTLDISTNSIIGNEGTVGDVSGSVTLTAQSLSGFGSSFENDIPNGNFTLDQTGTQAVQDDTVIDYSSRYTLTLITGGNLTFDSSLQNSGSGGIDIKAGGNVLIGGTNATGDVSVGSAGGTTSITADNVTVDAVYGVAQLGYAGAGGGDIDVSATGNITVEDFYNLDTGFIPSAQIGNGGPNVDTSGSVGGNIDVRAAGDITLLDDSYFSDYSYGNYGFAVIGNVNGYGASDSGNIVISNKGSLSLTGKGFESVAEIGNFSIADEGNQSGNITITSGAISLVANNSISEDDGGVGWAGIGAGGMFPSFGTTNCNIDITASSIDLLGEGTGGDNEVRIGSRGSGDVSGYDDITTSGDVELSAADGSEAFIGNSELDSGTLNSNIDIRAAGSISLLAQGDGETRIGAYDDSNEASTTNINVTAARDIILSDDNSSTVFGGAGQVWIGNYSDGTGSAGGNIDVSSTGGSVELEASDADGEGAFAVLGNFDGATTTTGNVTVTTSDAAAGNIVLRAADSTSYVYVGDYDIAGGNVRSNTTVATADSLDITDGQQITIGAGQTFGGTIGTGTVTGDATISAQALDGDLAQSFLNDIPNGDFTLDLSGTAPVNLDEQIDYSSPYKVTLITGGNLTFDASVQNSGSGGIDITAGGNVLIGGTNAAGDVSVGSAGGTTTVTGDNITVEADNGNAQIGYAGSGGGEIDVYAAGDIAIENLSHLSDDSWAQIGNGGENATGSITGNINVHAGGAISVLEADLDQNYYSGYALIGNMGGTDAAESGNITVDSTDALGIKANGLVSEAEIGNFSAPGSDEGASGNITINSGALSLVSNGASNNFFSEVWIGNGGQFSSSGEVSGNIDITATTVSLLANGSNPNDGGSQARIANRGTGNVSGNVNVTTTGDIDLSSNGYGLSQLGDTSLCAASPCTGLTGNLTVDAGGSILLEALNGGESRINESGPTGGTISVKAAGNIELLVTGSIGNEVALAMIGSFTPYEGGGADINVTSTNGSIILNDNATESGTNGNLAYIGNSSNASPGAIFGNITLSAPHGNIELSASGQGAGVEIGNLEPSIPDSTPPGDITGNITLSARGTITLSAPGQDVDVLVGGLNQYANGVAVNVTLDAGNAIDIDDGAQVQIGNTGLANVSGTVDITAQTLNGDLSHSFLNDIPNGNFTLDLTGSAPFSIDVPLDYSSVYTATLLNGGDILFDASVQNSGTGGIDITSAGTITIGGSGAKRNVAVGSAGGTTTIDAADLVLAADIGYAQLGFEGEGDGAIDITTTGDVTLDGGAGAGDFAQIGNGGYRTRGSESGDITIAAGGDITLSGGSGALAYAQIGSGGAESNQNSSGYSDTGLITISGDNIALDAGSGNAAYAQIGNGGYEVGKGLTGNGTESGNITLTAVNSVTLDGNGADAYAQIGNGGDLVDLDAAAGASGGATGDVTITVTATGSTVTLAAGTGSDAYAQIGDGGYAEDTPNGNAADFLTGGDVVVSATDLSLVGSDSGADAYAQIGNGDASLVGIANVDGDVTVTGIATETDGTASSAPAQIGNATGTGTVTGTVTCPGGDCGNTGQQEQEQQQENDTESVLTQPDTTADTDILLAVFSSIENAVPQLETEVSSEVAPSPLTPLEQMANSSSNGDEDYEGEQPSDNLVASLGESLDPAHGRKKNAYIAIRTLVPGVLKQIVSTTSRNPTGVPPADEDYSSWGNKALWR